MLCGSRRPRWSPPQPRRRLLKLCGKASSVLGSTQRQRRRGVPPPVQTGEKLAKVRVYLPPCLSVDAVHADDPFAILSSDLTSSFRQILHLTVARKSLVMTNCKVVVAYVLGQGYGLLV